MVDLVKALAQNKYINTQKFNFIPKTELNKYENVVVILSKFPHELFDELNSIIAGDDELLILNEKDTFV
jgi:hypothetical protein